MSVSGSVSPRFLAVPLSAAAGPSGTGNAVGEFGYAENGAASDLFCTSRKETCTAGRASEASTFDAANPFYLATTEASVVTGTPGASSCQLFVPAIPDRVLYYRVRYRDGGNRTLGLTQIGALISR